uniref:Uncharacterized protein n=1 Tax=Lactuca sativa TaxID=4236 RepID=A0A9R1ULA6_LACSA|nr:hypothetical protein LSAT_V11C800450760 [Lactuca sativa]
MFSKNLRYCGLLFPCWTIIVGQYDSFYKTLTHLTVGAGIGVAITWSATGNLHRLFRINLVGGVAAITTTWRFRKSVNSCIEQILYMDGSRMQKELANIMLRRYADHPITTKLISKRFYCDHVFDDSTSDMLKSRWHFRNNLVESPPHPQQPNTRESYDHDDNISLQEL